MEYKVSVLMPVYNGLPLIRASIASLLRQSFHQWECVIVDDGSSDGTTEFLHTLTDSRFLIHYFDINKGRPLARQKTLDLCSGDFITFLDAGDLYSENALEILLKSIVENSDMMLVSSAMCSFGTSTSIIRKRGVSTRVIRQFTQNVYPNFASSILRANRAKSISFNPTMQLGEDRDYLEKYLAGQYYMEIPNILYYYSEFDSVNKAKIRKSYYLEIKKNFRLRSIKALIICTMKLIYSIVVFPFISTRRIIQRRGRELSSDEMTSFDTECNQVIKSVLKEIA